MNNNNIHYHKLRCIGCHFPMTIEKCDCDSPKEHCYICAECEGTPVVEQWNKLNKKRKGGKQVE